MMTANAWPQPPDMSCTSTSVAWRRSLMSAVRDSDVRDIVVVGMVQKGTERTGMVLWCIVVVPKSWRGLSYVNWKVYKEGRR